VWGGGEGMMDPLDPLRRPSVSLTRCSVGPHVSKNGSRKTLLSWGLGLIGKWNFGQLQRKSNFSLVL